MNNLVRSGPCINRHSGRIGRAAGRAASLAGRPCTIKVGAHGAHLLEQTNNNTPKNFHHLDAEKISGRLPTVDEIIKSGFHIAKHRDLF